MHVSLCVNEWSVCVCACKGGSLGEAIQDFVHTPITGRSRQVWEECLSLERFSIA